jgi:ParB family chromosome partitioning protein
MANEPERKKSSLGDKLKKGKDVLFGTSENIPRVIEVDMVKLRANPDQPRRQFDEEALQELAASIEQHGLIQPITVMRDPENEDGFIMVAGERRFRAFQKLGRDSIPTIITRGNPDEIALIENIQRENLNSIEEAEALQKMMQRHGYTQEELAKIVGKARTTITELLSLTSLPEEIRQECRTSDAGVSKSALVELTRIKNTDKQLKIWEEIKHGGLTVRAARQKKASKPSTPKAPLSPALTVLSSGKHFVERLRSMQAENATLDEASYNEVLSLWHEMGNLIEQVKTTAKTDGSTPGNRG